LSLFGTLSLSRAYYYCRECGEGFCPYPQQARLPEHPITPAVARLSTLAGTVADSFEKGADLLLEMAAIRQSESSVRRTTLESGKQIKELFEQKVPLGSTESWDWHHDLTEASCAYISIDATGVPQQGPNGSKAEHRMAYVGAVFNPDVVSARYQGGSPTPMAVRYVSGLYPLGKMEPLMRSQGAEVGMDAADHWIALSDAGSGLESFLEKAFGRTEAVIVDYWHACEYLTPLSVAAYGETAQADSVRKSWCDLLAEEGGALLLAVLEEWDWPEESSGWEEALSVVRRYFGNHCHRMEYPEYLARGWQIGSGVIESACKTVVGQRLKLAGMRWSEEGADYLCHLRALYRSNDGQWQRFWNREFSLN